jgi:hypothetical protein
VSAHFIEEIGRLPQSLTHNELWGEDEPMTSVWYQAQFYSWLGGCWVPFGGNAKTEAGAQEMYERLTGTNRKRIVKVTSTTEVVVREE